MSALYKLVLNGQAAGQDVQNYVAYRLGAGIDPTLIPWGGGQVLAEEWVQEVMPHWLGAALDSYTLQTIDVYVYNPTFSPMFTQPFRQEVNQQGTNGGSMISPASYVTVKANLEPMLITEALIAPRRGWLSFGPVPEEWFTDGKLHDAFWNSANNKFNNLVEALGVNLNAIDPPSIFYPVRLKQNKVLGVNTVVGYADIQSWTVDRRLKMRRSRQYPA